MLKCKPTGNQLAKRPVTPNTRRRPILTAFRTTLAERALIDAIAEREAKSVTELLRDVVLPAVQRRARRYATELRGGARSSVSEGQGAGGETGGDEGGDSFREECVPVVEPGRNEPGQPSHQDRNS
jgi:hypothetical protein